MPKLLFLSEETFDESARLPKNGEELLLLLSLDLLGMLLVPAFACVFGVLFVLLVRLLVGVMSSNSGLLALMLIRSLASSLSNLNLVLLKSFSLRVLVELMEGERRFCCCSRDDKVAVNGLPSGIEGDDVNKLASLAVLLLLVLAYVLEVEVIVVVDVDVSV